MTRSPSSSFVYEHIKVGNEVEVVDVMKITTVEDGRKP